MPEAEDPVAIEIDFADFYRKDFPRLTRLLMVHSGARYEDACDAAQESYRRAWNCWSEIQSPQRWVRVTAIRAHHRQMERVRDEVRRAHASGWTEDFDDDALELSDQARELMTLITSLPPREAEVMALTFDGYAPREIAEILNEAHKADSETDRPQRTVTANAVSAALLAARRKLITRINGQGERE